MKQIGIKEVSSDSCTSFPFRLRLLPKGGPCQSPRLACQGNVNISGPGQHESFRFYRHLGSPRSFDLGRTSINLPGMCWRRCVLGRLRTDNRHSRDALRPLRALPVTEVPALVADDSSAVEVKHPRGWAAQHPPRRLLDGNAPNLPADA